MHTARQVLPKVKIIYYFKVVTSFLVFHVLFDANDVYERDWRINETLHL